MTPRRHAPFACWILGAAAGALLAGAPLRAQDELLDRVDDTLTFGAFHDTVGLRLSGTLDLEEYWIQQPDPGLLFSEGNRVFNPRLSLFLDAQEGPHVYAFLQARADNGFDPGDDGSRLRLDEYVVRYTPTEGTALNLQAGKFATVVGNWTRRHGSWDNPFITAPLPYENLTGIWDTNAASSADQVRFWAGVVPGPTRGGYFPDQYRNVPVVWGPSYASGAAASGQLGVVDYAFEVKNASLSSNPEAWGPGAEGWSHPTVSGRIGWVPDPMWNFGLSASTGSYLENAALTLPAGRSRGQYAETVLGQDATFAWHRVQVWAEAYEARFAVPSVGNADTEAYYVEAKFKFLPQVFGALRWNQQVFSSLAGGGRWSRNVWRIDAGPGYRPTAHTQVKVQYSIERQDAETGRWGQLTAVQLTARF